ncbi:unnamed protein product [Ambrosiozyma monospora]|uniref:Unnamed protein product n=1 Tax=Ambrosiozyma monospora TaxID=43982 RepID=A0ACB5SVY6_AMBMO|nr:unnamed protein product [Ambrosiozyma monospora]
MSEKTPYQISSSEKKISNVEELDVSAGSIHSKQIYTETKQGLKSRHVQIIALAGAIGTGLFVGSGAGLSSCGPAGLLTGYAILCIFVWFIMNLLSEMVTFIPLSGQVTVNALCERYTGNKSMGFTAGINLYYAQAFLVPSEISAAAFVIQYWNDKINVAAWIAIFWISLVALNFLAVQFFGEVEFWIGSIKVITITGLIILGIVLFFGGGPNQHGVLGFHYWKDPGAFAEHLASSHTNTARFLDVWTSLIKAGFAFIMGPELIACAAAEAHAPRVNLPKATSRFIYRLIFFYFMGPLVIGVIIAYNDDRLMGAIAAGSSGAAASPFVIGIQNAGIKVLNHIVNGCILTSAYSSGNSYIYGSSRTLHSMAVKGDIHHVFARCTKQGVPYVAVGLSACIALLSFLNVSSGSAKVFTWLSNLSTVSGFISWIFISITYLRYRKALAYHGVDDRVTFRPRFQIFGAYACIIFFTILSLTNGYAVFFDFNAPDFVAAYITIPIIIVVYICHMLWFRNFRLFSPPEEIDCISGLDEAERQEREYVAPVAKNFLEKIWFWIA